MAENGKSVAMVISEAKDDLKDFLETRYRLLASELKEKIWALKFALPMILMALLFVGAGFLLLTVALVAAVAAAVGWGWAFLVIAAFYLVTAGILGFLGWRELSAEGLVPKRTIEVLKQDKTWLTNEARTQL